MATPYETAGSLYRKQERNQFFKTKNIQRKLADKSKFQIPIGHGSGKKCLLFEMGGSKFVDIVEENFDGSVTLAKRANLPLDGILALQILTPVILAKLDKGEVGEEYILDQKTKLYLITSKIYPSARAILRPTARIFVSIRYKFTTDDGEEGVVSK